MKGRCLKTKRGISEKQVVEGWQRLLEGGTRLFTRGKEPLKVIYPGRTNDDRGADFRDAVILSGGKLVKGDIEVHVRSSDWQAHHHSRDPTYNRVILHVAMWDDSGGITPQNGRNIPVLALDSLIRSPDSGWQGSKNINKSPCYHTGSGDKAIAACLDEAGEARLFTREQRFQNEIQTINAGQVLYEGMMESLGYSRNKQPFLELARRSPLKNLEFIIAEESSHEECLSRLQALLIGTAGLLPSQRPSAAAKTDFWTQKLERLWSISKCPASPYSAWSLFKVRPNNYPVRRLAAASYLLLRFGEVGLLKGLLDAIKAKESREGIEEALMVDADGYWSDHYDFGRHIEQSGPLMGAGRAGVMAVNVVLPFACAWARLHSCAELENSALDIYKKYHPLPLNSVEKHMKSQLGLSGKVINSARRQQGLIHLYNTFCIQGRCGECPLRSA